MVAGESPKMKETRLELIDQLFEMAEGILVPGKLVYKVLSVIVNLSNCERGAVLSLTGSTKFEAQALVGMSANSLNLVKDVCNSFLGELGKNSTLVYVADTRKDDKFRKISVLKNSEILSFVCVPLKLDGKPYGVLYLDSTISTQLFSSIDLERISRYSRLVTNALIHEQKLSDAAVSIPAVSVDDYLAERYIDELERQQVHALLEKHGWNVTRTAMTLGMPRRTLYNKMTKHEIRRPRRNKAAATAAE
jgi:transcriptional regulator with GAF, ATPase, and Fis domain